MWRVIVKYFFRPVPALLLLALIALSGQQVRACDADDELPGALPPAPNGGALGEADRIDKTETASPDRADAEAKLYWEGVHLKDQKQVQLTLVSAVPPKTAIFTVLSPTKEFSDLQVKVEDPRKLQTFKVPFAVKENHVILDFDGRDLNRFIVHVSGKRHDGAREALVQIEEE